MTETNGKLAGKVAVVTGGGSGIGRAAALRFAQEGAAVVVADVVGDQAEAVAKEIEANGGRAIGLAVDVSDPGQVETMAETATREFGGVDVLMTAAGLLSLGAAPDSDPDRGNPV